MYNFENVKGLYEDGYRCIYYDNTENNPSVYLKNFESEDSKEIQFDGLFSESTINRDFSKVLNHQLS